MKTSNVTQGNDQSRPRTNERTVQFVVAQVKAIKTTVNIEIQQTMIFFDCCNKTSADLHIIFYALIAIIQEFNTISMFGKLQEC